MISETTQKLGNMSPAKRVDLLRTLSEAEKENLIKEAIFNYKDSYLEELNTQLKGSGFSPDFKESGFFGTEGVKYIDTGFVHHRPCEGKIYAPKDSAMLIHDTYCEKCGEAHYRAYMFETFIDEEL